MAKNLLKKIKIAGKDIWPIVEGGKGIGVSNGVTAGHFAKAGAVGTFSGVNADYIDEKGKYVPLIYNQTTRKSKHDELIEYSIKGGISQAKIAHDISGGNGLINMNVLWEMGGVQRVLQGIMDGAKGLINGITCGAGMPYKLAEFAEHYKVHYYPIVSSMRAFRALWLRSYRKASRFLGGVVYEDPWKAGGHNGLSNSEDPLVAEDPYPRVRELRKYMNEMGLNDVPIIMAGGVWHIKDWEHWINDPEVAPVAFQFGTRPIMTQESPVSDNWKQRLLTLEEGDIALNRFSPTGFYSSAVNNNFIKELYEREARQIEYSRSPDKEKDLLEPFTFGPRGRPIYIKLDDKIKAQDWIDQGFSETMKTPDETIVFVTPEKREEIIKDQSDCMGCLSHCKFSNWKDHGDYTTGKKADPRSFCIQKTLMNVLHTNDTEDQLMFSGHQAFNFKTDPFYSNGFIPTVEQLVDRIIQGN